jgi:hypothetical protein
MLELSIWIRKLNERNGKLERPEQGRQKAKDICILFFDFYCEK